MTDFIYDLYFIINSLIRLKERELYTIQHLSGDEFINYERIKRNSYAKIIQMNWRKYKYRRSDDKYNSINNVINKLKQKESPGYSYFVQKYAKLKNINEKYEKYHYKEEKPSDDSKLIIFYIKYLILINMYTSLVKQQKKLLDETLDLYEYIDKVTTPAKMKVEDDPSLYSNIYSMTHGLLEHIIVPLITLVIVILT